MSATGDFLERELERRLATRGAQVSVSIDGEPVLDLAVGDDGLGRDVTPRTVFKVYCSIKPVTTLAVARLVESGQIDLDEPMARRLPAFASLERGVTVRHVLTHTAGLQYPSAVFMEMVPPDKRRTRLEQHRGEGGWRLGTDAAYSEHLAWHLIGWLIEDVTGGPLREHLRTTVIEPLGLADTYIGMTAGEYSGVVDRLGINCDLTGAWPGTPFLVERTERVCRETNPAYGGYSTARDLQRLYAAILAQLDGVANPALPTAATLVAFCRTARPRTYDAVLDRECEFGLGFMTGLADHRFGGDCSALAFGHSGNVGSSFAFADPEHGLAAGVVLNGLVDPDTAFLRRPGLVHAIYADVAAAGSF